MSCIKEILVLKGDNYSEWRKKIDLTFIYGEVDWVITTPHPAEPPALVRGIDDTDAEWRKKQRDYAPLKMAYDLENEKWTNANENCMAFIKNTIEHAIVSSIANCYSTIE